MGLIGIPNYSSLGGYILFRVADHREAQEELPVGDRRRLVFRGRAQRVGMVYVDLLALGSLS